MSKLENILVVAFDGLDYEKIRKYNCENIKQEEFGKVDITDYDRFGTPWLWASFLTGQKHNFRYVKKLENPALESLETFFWKNVPPMTKWSGIRGKHLYKKLLRVGMTSHTKKDLEATSFIDELDMESYYVPAYNEYPFNEFSELASTTVKVFEDNDVSKEEAFRRHRGFYLRQQEELGNLLRNDSRKSMMFYFKFTDSAQHLIFNEDMKINYTGREYGEKELYEEIDKLAAKIKDLSKHDLVLFISDHGLSDGDHNENAFYSSNQELGLENPHITEFHNIIVEKVEKTSQDIEGIEI